MPLLCAACLLVVRLGPAPEPAPAPAPPVTDPTAESPTRSAEPPAPAPRDGRLALRDPFEVPSSGALRHAPASPDLLDPFTRPRPPATASRPTDLRDPFVDPAPHRCAVERNGVPIQRPRALLRTAPTCPVLDKPLRNPFAPPAPPPSGAPG